MIEWVDTFVVDWTCEAHRKKVLDLESIHPEMEHQSDRDGMCWKMFG